MVRYEDLRPGARIRVTRRVKVGMQKWESVVSGTVIRTERRRNGLHVDRSSDDKAFQDTMARLSMEVVDLPGAEVKKLVEGETALASELLKEIGKAK